MRPELERVIQDVEILKTGYAEMRVLMNRLFQELARQSRMLKNIQQALVDDQHERIRRDHACQRESTRRDHALKRTVWIASAIGPALLTTLWHLLKPGGN